MARQSLKVEEILALLAAAPESIAAATAGLTERQLQTSPAPEEWSIRAVLAHLRACADVWGDAIAAILSEDHPTLRAVNPRTWAVQTGYHEQEFWRSFHLYTEQRSRLLAVLQALLPAGWDRQATLKGAGKPLLRSVHGYAEGLAIHERAHRKQIARLARQLREKEAGATDADD